MPFLSTPPVSPVQPWLADLVAQEAFQLSHLALRDSSDWQWRGGAVAHRTGRFFKVIGVQAHTADGTVFERPLLDQREIGTLALMGRSGPQGAELLVQAKAEPGNVGLFQLAPSYQATASNTARAHGGKPPPLGPWFLQASRGRWIADSLQSEQGSRFYGKRNRNATLLAEGEPPPTPYHRWMPVRQLLALLGEDHLLNTDLRSTLLCSDWDWLADGAPFSQPGFAQQLLASYRLPEDQAYDRLPRVQAMLDEPASWRAAPQIVPLESLRGWQMGDEGPGGQPPGSQPYRLRHIRVTSASREVTQWDQPIVQSAGVGRVVLPLGHFNGVPHLLLKRVAEPGFGLRCELSPALIVEPGGTAPATDFAAQLLQGATVLVSCRQSEEGGRFLCDENTYAIADVGAVVAAPPDHCWLSLAQLRTLILQGSRLTNEARSVLSLLLRWL